MRDYTKKTQTGSIPSAVDFRAQATGMGSTIQNSLASGMCRSREVAEQSGPKANLAANGYPPKMADGGYDLMCSNVLPADDEDMLVSGKPRALNTTRPNRT